MDYVSKFLEKYYRQDYFVLYIKQNLKSFDFYVKKYNKKGVEKEKLFLSIYCKSKINLSQSQNIIFVKDSEQKIKRLKDFLLGQEIVVADEFVIGEYEIILKSMGIDLAKRVVMFDKLLSDMEKTLPVMIYRKIKEQIRLLNARYNALEQQGNSILDIDKIEKQYRFVYEEIECITNKIFNRNKIFINDNYLLARLIAFNSIPFLSDIEDIYHSILEVCGLDYEQENFKEEFGTVLNKIYSNFNIKDKIIINDDNLCLKNRDINNLSEGDKSLVLLSTRFALIVMVSQYNIILPLYFDQLYSCISLEYETTVFDILKRFFKINTIFAEQVSKNFLEKQGIDKNIKIYEDVKKHANR